MRSGVCAVRSVCESKRVRGVCEAYARREAERSREGGVSKQRRCEQAKEEQAGNTGNKCGRRRQRGIVYTMGVCVCVAGGVGERAHMDAVASGGSFDTWLFTRSSLERCRCFMRLLRIRATP